jgi:hypothetical protein
MSGKIHGVVEEAKHFYVLAALRGHSKHDEVASLATVASDMKAAQSLQSRGCEKGRLRTWSLLILLLAETRQLIRQPSAASKRI